MACPRSLLTCTGSATECLDRSCLKPEPWERTTSASGCSSWPSATAKDADASRNATANRTPGSNFKAGETLTDAIDGWPTPLAKDYDTGASPSRAGRDNPGLAFEASEWQTPGAMDGGSVRRGGDRGDELLLSGQASTFPRGSSLPDHPPSSSGESRCNTTRVLNPRFVEWLMGFPPGFTALCLDGSTGSEGWATRWSLYMERSRCACSRLAGECGSEMNGFTTENAENTEGSDA